MRVVSSVVQRFRFRNENEWPTRVAEFVRDTADRHAAESGLGESRAADLTRFLEAVSVAQCDKHLVCVAADGVRANGADDFIDVLVSVPLDHVRRAVADAADEAKADGFLVVAADG